MEDIIMKIIDIEEKAQEIVSDAKKADMESEANIAKETAKLHEDIENKVHKKTVSIMAAEDEEAEKEILALREKTDEQISNLEQKYNDKKDVWTEKIVQSIIG